MESSGSICPSSRGKAGAQLLGVRQPGGWVSILSEPKLLDAEFFEEAAKHGRPEERFRFANKCVESGCGQWKGGRCSVGDRVAAVELRNAQEADLPVCSIRNKCRWYGQSGADACRGCFFVITEITEEEIE